MFLAFSDGSYALFQPYEWRHEQKLKAELYRKNLLKFLKFTLFTGFLVFLTLTYVIYNREAYYQLTKGNLVKLQAAERSSYHKFRKNLAATLYYFVLILVILGVWVYIFTQMQSVEVMLNTIELKQKSVIAQQLNNKKVEDSYIANVQRRYEKNLRLDRSVQAEVSTGGRLSKDEPYKIETLKNAEGVMLKNYDKERTNLQILIDSYIRTLHRYYCLLGFKAITILVAAANLVVKISTTYKSFKAYGALGKQVALLQERQKNFTSPATLEDYKGLISLKGTALRRLVALDLDKMRSCLRQSFTVFRSALATEKKYARQLANWAYYRVSSKAPTIKTNIKSP